jgi:hypothetical protein
MAGHLKPAAGCAVMALAVSLLAAGGSTAKQFPSLARTAKVGTGCKLTAAAPTEASDQITGKGSIRCNASRTVHYFIATQISEQGRWSDFGTFDDEGFRIRAADAPRRYASGQLQRVGPGQGANAPQTGAGWRLGSPYDQPHRGDRLQRASSALIRGTRARVIVTHSRGPLPPAFSAIAGRHQLGGHCFAGRASRGATRSR